MIAITKRLRLFRGVPNSKEELEKFRQEARATLNKPYEFHASPQAKPWEMFGSDPTEGFFKPFGKVGQPTFIKAKSGPVKSFSALTRVKGELASLDWRRVSVPIGLASLALAAFLLWQTFATTTSFQGVVNQNPVATNPTGTEAPQVSPVGEIVPPGTELEPGGPYTGTGSTQPVVSTSGSGGGSTNLNQGTPAPAPAPTCPTDMVCSGQALDGSACTTSNPCRVVQLTTPLSTGGTIIETGKDSLGNQCSTTNPCILTH